MDNVTTTALALQKKRLAKHHEMNRQWQKVRFARWVYSRCATFYVFYRVTGAHDFKASSTIKLKLDLMPCCQMKGKTLVKPIFNLPFTLFVYVNNVQPYNQKWISIDCTISHFPRQKLTLEISDQDAEKILPQLPLPTYTKSHADRNTEPTLLSKLRFYRFHMFFHQGDTYEKRYGIIDQMWDENGKKLELSLPPEMDFGAPDAKVPQKHFLNPSYKAPQPESEFSLESFLKDYGSTARYIKQ